MTASQQLPPHLGPHFSTLRARQAGVSPSRLRAGDLTRPFHGVRSLGDPADAWEDETRRRMAAFASRMPESMFFVRAAALVAASLPVPTALQADSELPVGVLHPVRAAKGVGVLGLQVRSHLASVRHYGAVRATDPATTWAMLAKHLSHRDLVALADAIVRVERKPGTRRILRLAHASADDLRAVLERGRWPGAGRLRAALADVRDGVASLPETHLRLAVVAAGLPEPDVDVDVRDASGFLLGCSELAFPAHRVAVEYEGEHHRTSRRQWNRDIDKYEAYADAGWSVVRVTAAHLYPVEARAVRRVGDALLRAGWRPA